MKLVTIIPALNEDRTIKRVIQTIPRNIPGITSQEVIVISDGSSDQTVSVSQSAGASTVEHKTSQGVGAAFHTGLKAALKSGADIIVNIDADGQFNSQDIIKLVTPILNQEAEFVTATRFADPLLEPSMPLIKRWGNRQMVRIINFITNKKFTDVSCGFRAYSREAALQLTLFGKFTYTQETFLDLSFKNISMTEVPLEVRGEREFGKSRVASNLWRFALKASTIIFRAARDYQPQYFFGLPGLVVFLAGIISGLFLLNHYLTTGQTFPYRSLVEVSALLIIVGTLLIFISMLADMLHRNRIIQEEAVYLARKQAYEK